MNEKLISPLMIEAMRNVEEYKNKSSACIFFAGMLHCINANIEGYEAMPVEYGKIKEELLALQQYVKSIVLTAMDRECGDDVHT
jgi:hypothetical protein